MANDEVCAFINTSILPLMLNNSDLTLNGDHFFSCQIYDWVHFPLQYIMQWVGIFKLWYIYISISHISTKRYSFFITKTYSLRQIRSVVLHWNASVCVRVNRKYNICWTHVHQTTCYSARSRENNNYYIYIIIIIISVSKN
jgi:hypothetical protein